jgi:hypothetical protein
MTRNDLRPLANKPGVSDPLEKCAQFDQMFVDFQNRLDRLEQRDVLAKTERERQKRVSAQ